MSEGFMVKCPKCGHVCGDWFIEKHIEDKHPEYWQEILKKRSARRD